MSGYLVRYQVASNKAVWRIRRADSICFKRDKAIPTQFEYLFAAPIKETDKHPSAAALLVGQLPASPSRVRARSLVRQVLQTGANALAIWHAALTPVLLEEMRKRAIAVWTWTVDDEIAMRDLIMMGVNGIITNLPNVLNEVIDDLQQDNQIQPPLGRRRVRRSRWGRRRQLRKLHAKPRTKRTDRSES